MAQRRKRKHSDQEQTEVAYQIIQEAIQANPQVETTLWAGAPLSTLVSGYINSRVTYKEFCSELDRIKSCYKSWWERGND